MKTITVYVTDDGAEYEDRAEAEAHEQQIIENAKNAVEADAKTRKSFLFVHECRFGRKPRNERWPRGSWRDGDVRLYVWTCVAPMSVAIQLAIERANALDDRGMSFDIDEDVGVGDSRQTYVYIGNRPEFAARPDATNGKDEIQ